MNEPTPGPALTLDVGKQFRRLSRRDWWLWVSTVVVMTFATAAFVVLTYAAQVQQSNPYLPINQAMWGLLSLILVFNIHAAHRQWQTRRQRKDLIREAAGVGEEEAELVSANPGVPLDPLTGLVNRTVAEQAIAKEIIVARRKNAPLTLLVMDINDFRQMNQTYSTAFGDTVLYHMARRLRKASRGSDLAARIGGDEFLLVLPDCTVEGVRNVLARLKPLEVEWRGRQYVIDFEAAWVDYHPGEMPTELLRRMDDVLDLYRRAGQESLTPAVAH